MVKLTESLHQWLSRNHKDIYPLVCFGHTELLTDEMKREYVEWCKTEDGKQYLEGGEHYKEPR